MHNRSKLWALGGAVLGMALAGGASAAPIETYSQVVSGGLTTVQVTGSPSCPVGSGNCLTNGPLAVASASVTLDIGLGELQNLSISVPGPGSIALTGYNGYEKIVFSDAAFQSSGTATLGPGGNFFIDGTVTASKLELFLAGNLGAVPDIVVLNYSTAPNPNFASGTLGISGDQLTVSINGLDLGSFPDPITGDLAAVQADFNFVVATVPEPNAALLYGIGLLIAGSAVRRRATATAR